MTYTISKDFEFSASHRLHLLPPEHKCSRQHGHNYVVRVEVSAERLDGNNMVIDFGDLGFVGRFLDEELDHRDLNEVYTVPQEDELDENPTAEFLAESIWNITWEELRGSTDLEFSLAVGVSETPKTWAWYRE